MIKNFKLNFNTFWGNKIILEEIVDSIKKLKKNKVLVIYDKNLLKNSNYLRNVLKKVKKSFKTFLFEFSFKFEPTYNYLDETKNNFKKFKPEIILAIGGGSCIDYAKGIALLTTNKKKSINYRGFPCNLKKPIPLIACPSTTGTGTEIAFNAVFIDTTTNLKLGINYSENYPIISFMDTELCKKTPNQVLINSTIGALGRSLETFSTIKSNIFTLDYSIKCFNLILDNLPKVLINKNNIEAWENLQIASFYSMVALSNSSSGPAGPISYYLSTNYNIPQALGYGISSFLVAKYNFKKGYTKYAELIDKHFKYKNKKTKSKEVIFKIEKLVNHLNIKKEIKKFDLKNKKFDINFFLKKTRQAFKMNPVNLNNEDIKNILEMVKRF
jgi:alcohol dehydrogenase class IV